MYLYPKKFPNIGELVVVKATTPGDSGVECELPEYGNVLAFLPLGEITKKRTHIVSREIKVGKPKVCEVINVDVPKGYIDLSKRHVNRETETEKLQEYKNAMKVVHLINDAKLDYEQIIYPLYDNDLCPHALLDKSFEAFKEKVEEFVGDINISSCVPIYDKKFAKKVEKSIVYVKVSCPDRGIDPIKEVLLIGLNHGLKINLVSSPEYMVIGDDHEKVLEALELMKQCAKELRVCFEVEKCIGERF